MLQKIETRDVLILVKTYPQISRKYSELVCTAGIDREGNWIRLYPFPVKAYLDNGDLSKYTWIRLQMTKREKYKDDRPESFCPQRDTIQVLETIDSNDRWFTRRKLIFDKIKTFKNIGQLIDDAKANRRSLALFKPTEIIDCQVVEEPGEYTEEEKKRFEESLRQSFFFENSEITIPFDKLPFSLKFKFLDDAKKEHTMSVLDWEVGALWKKHLKGKSIEYIKEQLKTKFYRKDGYDLFFYLGTMNKKVKMNVPNPWTIIGLANVPKIKKDPQMTFPGF